MVRCKECKHWGDKESLSKLRAASIWTGYNIPDDHMATMDECSFVSTEPEFGCIYGEK